MIKRVNSPSQVWGYFFALSSILISHSSNAAIVSVEPDGFVEGTNIETAYAGVTLSVEGRPDATVIAIDGFSSFNSTNIATTGSLVFGYTPPVASLPTGQDWDQTTFGLLRADFDVQTDFIQIDLIYNDDDVGGLWAYDSFGNLLDSVIAQGDGRGVSSSFCPPFCDTFTTVSILRETNDIAYILVGGVNAEGLFLDNMQFNAVPVPAAIWLFGSGLIGLVGLARRKKT
ncbi:MAG: hypothetical protein DIZ80_03140 [endosymbiont of Galathealinum brachiosum]|uniref:Ice-binding protein C-terminal domain-containing protein n=1 Tax=endosymbiont of Galathealinum brachiosum TaxID=2200906 RepID=A0A370DHT4_9GAMM|nr:MAG: hypothetical protein DIZ80_03140 [endosymbiont of Galathealinum brachiosum]